METNKSKQISVVIACYYSENSLKTVVNDICQTLEGEALDYEIILVNDGSKDQTFKTIESLCSSNSNIRGIELSKNFGQQSAMLAGFNYAKGELVLYCDDDGQSPVYELPKFLKKMEEGYDMVWAKYPDQKRGFINGIGANLNNRMLKFLFNKPLDLSFGNMWLAKRFIIEETIKTKNPRLYLGGLFLAASSNMANVLCKQGDRLSGSSNYSLLNLITVWLNGVTAFSIAPLRIASFMGTFTALVGFAYIVYLIVLRMNNPDVPLGYSSIMSALLFIGGMLMMMIGVVGEYVGRIYSNMYTKPQFVIKEKVNISNDK